MPYIDLSQIQVQFTDDQHQTKQAQGDWLEEMKKWIISLGRTPAAEVKAKWEAITGHTLNANGLQLLMEHLGLTGRSDTGT